MGKYNANLGKETVFLGIDLHRRTWYVTARTFDQEICTTGIPGRWEALEGLLVKLDSNDIKVVYEAGYFGF